MAYENGYEVKNYIGECIERYRRDPLIFTKATQLVSVFMARADWPYCFNELNEVATLILGDSLETLIFVFADRYLNDPRMVWPEDLPKDFQEQLKAFYMAVGPIVNQYWVGQAQPLKFLGIAQASTGNRPAIIRIMRMDGEKLDVEMDNQDLENAIRILQGFLNERRSDA